MTRIAIFASGTGTNARQIMERFRNHPTIQVVLIVANHPEAGVLDIARENTIKTLVINKKQLNEPGFILDQLKQNQVNFIVLAGFLLQIPPAMVQAYPGKIVNIHPALLPAYGGKGMYGMYVHEAVIANKEKESGISIHYVDELYDHGECIFQARCAVEPNDTPQTLAGKIRKLEHTHYPEVLEQILQNPR